METVLWKIAEWLLERFGKGALDRFLRWRAQRSLRAASGRKITILLAKLDGDTGDSHRRTLHETIRREFADAVEIIRLPNPLPLRDGHEYDSERRTYAAAQKWLKRSRGDLLVAGREKGKNAAGETVLSLQFVVAEIGSGNTGSYKLTDTLDLPVKFMTDFGAAIAARIMLGVAPIFERPGHYLVPLMRIAAERLEPFVKRLTPAFDADTRASLLLSYALVCSTLGNQAGSNTDLERAISAYREALKEFTRERVPLDWAMTQNNLGNALSRLGARASGTARLEQAVAAYREALKEYTRERVPLDWAMTQNNLGTALRTLGERESGTATLEQAVAAFREALKERTRERVPLDWAMTQNNLGTALSTLGERESGTATLEQAVAAYREALKEFTRERVPLDWATTQNNLGNALRTLGERESGTARLEQAVAAYREALKERTRERVPLDWATTQNNLGTALSGLGERESGTARLEQAVAAYRLALEVLEAAEAAHYLEIVRANLVRVKKLIEERKGAPPPA